MNYNNFNFSNQILYCNKNDLTKLYEKNHDEMDYLLNNFAGKVISDISELDTTENTTIYFCGDTLQDYLEIEKLVYKNLLVVKELSYNHHDNMNFISNGKLPININNVGIFVREFFDKDYFNLVEKYHQFQKLTESDKPGFSLRTGLYLTDVEKKDNIYDFKLMRCSTNFTGATDNFCDADKEILDNVNNYFSDFFEDKFNLNHVLVQTYHNNIKDGESAKETKARIKIHSDKTKDMDNKGVIAFCTFYNNYKNGKFREKRLSNIKRDKTDYFNWKYKNGDVLTKLRFKVKNELKNTGLVEKFDLTLYPNSIFVINLDTNRKYTHEICPSYVSVNHIPTRMGYVIRCSNTLARNIDGITHVKFGDKYKPLEEVTPEKIKKLKDIYFNENTTAQPIIYDKEDLNFSLNKGDYATPYV